MQMKKIAAVLLTTMMAVSLAACGGSQAGAQTFGSEETQEEVQEEEQTDAEEEASEAQEEVEQETSAEPQDEETTAETEVNAGDAAAAPAENKVLILYFSANNMNDTDAVSSATPIIDGASSVEWIANIIQEQLGGDLVPIIPAQDYPLGYDDVADAAKKEADNEVHPAIVPLSVNPEDYQTVFIGYPMWWYRMPMVLETFFDTYDLSGKTIVPFNTHEGSVDGGTYEMIRDREPDATVLDGIAIRGGEAGEDDARNEVIEWLGGLKLN